MGKSGGDRDDTGSCVTRDARLPIGRRTPSHHLARGRRVHPLSDQQDEPQREPQREPHRPSSNVEREADAVDPIRSTSLHLGPCWGDDLGRQERIDTFWSGKVPRQPPSPDPVRTASRGRVAAISAGSARARGRSHLSAPLPPGDKTRAGQAPAGPAWLRRAFPVPSRPRRRAALLGRHLAFRRSR